MHEFKSLQMKNFQKLDLFSLVHQTFISLFFKLTLDEWTVSIALQSKIKIFIDSKVHQINERTATAGGCLCVSLSPSNPDDIQ